jgi:Bcr/CflA subfamily drug resistance transporter
MKPTWLRQIPDHADKMGEAMDRVNSTENPPNEIIQPDAASPPPRPLRLAPLVLLTALSVLPVNVILPSLPHIAAAFQADFALVSLSVALYAIVTAAIEIVAGAISDRYGRRPVALTAIVIFIAASLGCALANGIAMFLVFRALQASIAACFSVALVMIKDTSSGHHASSRFGYLAMGWALAPMLGPLIGGSLDAVFGWRAIFIVLAILGAAVLVLCIRELRETAEPSSRSRKSYLAAYGLLLRSARFWAYASCMACSMGTLYVFLGGAPLIAGRSLGASTAQLGLYMGIVPAGFMFGSFLAGRHGAAGHLPGAMLIVARLLTCAGLLFGLGLSMAGETRAFALFAPCIFIGIGNGLTMPVANAGVLSIHPHVAGTAAGLVAAMSIGGGALIAAIASPFLDGDAPVQSFFLVMLVPASLALLAAVCTALSDRP